MVSLREWWEERWQALADWEQSLAQTLGGALVLSYLISFLERAITSLSTLALGSILGLAAVVALQYRTHRQFVDLRAEFDEQWQSLCGMQRTALRKIDYIVTVMSDATPDGGERASHAPQEWLHVDHSRDSDYSTWRHAGVILFGCAAGMFVAVELGVSDPGSLSATAAAVAGGLVATGVRWLWTDDEKSQPPGDSSSEGLDEAGAACDSESLREAHSLAFLLDGRDVEVGDGRVTFRSRDGRRDLHLEPDAGSGEAVADRDR